VTFKQGTKPIPKGCHYYRKNIKSENRNPERLTFKYVKHYVNPFGILKLHHPAIAIKDIQPFGFRNRNNAKVTSGETRCKSNQEGMSLLWKRDQTIGKPGTLKE
jgi:hypothetical protein